MKIRKIELENHPFFGNIKIDFTNNGKTVDTIIIAGENGCGKSQLLNLIFSHSGFNRDMIQRNEKRFFEIEVSDQDIESYKNMNRFSQYFHKGIQQNIISIAIDYNLGGQQIQITAINGNGEHTNIPEDLFIRNKTTSIIFSDIEINYAPDKIQYVTSKEIDVHDGSSLRSNRNLATEIAQLFVDMINSDNQDYISWAKNNESFDKTKLSVRMDRFTNAFNLMFPSKKFKEIRNKEGSKEIIFTENGKDSTLSQLSSGEKQIVFRGGFLLKDINSLKGALVLIDEPEISLHPIWQMKIMNFYKNIFTDRGTGIQTSQIIAVTHSPFIIHNPNRANDKVIVLKKDANGNIKVSNNPEFYSWTNEEVIKNAFNIDLSTTSAQNIVFVEGETDEKYLKKCLEIMGNSDIEVHWIGSYNIAGNAVNTGDSALISAYNFFISNYKLFHDKKLIILFDCDVKKIPASLHNVNTQKMTRNVNNQIYSSNLKAGLSCDVSLQTYH